MYALITAANLLAPPSKWFTASGTKGLYVEKGAPWQNCYAESFNSRFRDECLNINLFYTVKEASAIIADWQSQYTHRSPHSALGGLPPSLFAEQ
jgi:putative transposase